MFVSKLTVGRNRIYRNLDHKAQKYVSGFLKEHVEGSRQFSENLIGLYEYGKHNYKRMMPNSSYAREISPKYSESLREKLKTISIPCPYSGIKLDSKNLPKPEKLYYINDFHGAVKKPLIEFKNPPASVATAEKFLKGSQDDIHALGFDNVDIDSVKKVLKFLKNLKHDGELK